MHLICERLHAFDAALPATLIRVDRLKLARRLWRTRADDGEEFGFDLRSPLSHGDTVWATAATRYVIEQAVEPVLAIPLDPQPEAAAVLGWIVGNLHFLIEAQPDRLLAPDDPALRQSLDRFGIAYDTTNAVFQPHRLAASVVHAHSSAPAGAREHPFIRPLPMKRNFPERAAAGRSRPDLA